MLVTIFLHALIENLLRFEIPSGLRLLSRLANSRFSVVNIGVTEFLRTHGYAANGERLSHSWESKFTFEAAVLLALPHQRFVFVSDRHEVGLQLSAVVS